jgi:DNA transformation protein
MATAKGKARNRYVEFLIEQFAPPGEITGRAMFGGYCLYCDGIVFGLVANSELYIDGKRKARREEGLGAGPNRVGGRCMN